ncbi:hypothetical protein [Blastococcus sp. CT_GayMR16]|uniref:hypothetical protein n=1 Tax=Blastococcus sp. CT_GayMR16 TaxID=2559607 RepID=UPI001073240E|nr:hypothetical protein [Blastococcus sp. CT_GayMR16]TFV89921.1 hypothetical protein E4P38_05575 [Blastococcus sp. CT_GayMR16]
MESHHMPLTDDDRALLEALQSAGGPAGIFDVVITLNRGSEGAPRGQEWTARQLELIDTFVDLYRRGLVDEVAPADWHTGDVYALTPHGHAALAR